MAILHHGLTDSNFYNKAIVRSLAVSFLTQKECPIILV